MINARRRRADRLVVVALSAAAGTVVAIAAAILGFIARAGLVGYASGGFFAMTFGRHWAPDSPHPSYSFLPYLVSTGVSALGAILLGAVPAILAAVCVSELAISRMRPLFRRVLEISAAIPSVVYGYAALTWLVPLLANPVRGCQGLGLAPAILLLAVMVTPTVGLLSLDALARVPLALRDASAALGASPWQTTWRAVVPAAWRGIVTATFYGFARAAGETMAVQMVIGNGTYGPIAGLGAPGARMMPSACTTLGPLAIFRPTSTLATRIVMDLPNTQPGTPWNHALFSMSLLLLGMSTTVVLLTRCLSRRAAS